MNILDLDPQSFEVYLAESNPPPEQRDFLLREYRKRNSMFAPGYEALQEAERELADEGRRRLSLLPASVPQGMSFYDAVRAGEAELALPAFLTGTAESAMNVVDMPGATLRGPVSQEEMEQSAAELSEYLMLGAAPAVARAAVEGVDPSMVRMSGMGDNGGPPMVDRARVSSGLYSPSMDAVQKINQNAGTYQQLRAQILKAGGKEEELRFAGLDDMFEPNEKVTRQQLEDALADNVDMFALTQSRATGRIGDELDPNDYETMNRLVSDYIDQNIDSEREYYQREVLPNLASEQLVSLRAYVTPSDPMPDLEELTGVSAAELDARRRQMMEQEVSRAGYASIDEYLEDFPNAQVEPRGGTLYDDLDHAVESGAVGDPHEEALLSLEETAYGMDPSELAEATGYDFGFDPGDTSYSKYMTPGISDYFENRYAFADPAGVTAATQPRGLASVHDFGTNETPNFVHTRGGFASVAGGSDNAYHVGEIQSDYGQGLRRESGQYREETPADRALINTSSEFVGDMTAKDWKQLQRMPDDENRVPDMRGNVVERLQLDPEARPLELEDFQSAVNLASSGARRRLEESIDRMSSGYEDQLNRLEDVFASNPELYGDPEMRVRMRNSLSESLRRDQREQAMLIHSPQRTRTLLQNTSVPDSVLTRIQNREWLSDEEIQNLYSEGSRVPAAVELRQTLAQRNINPDVYSRLIVEGDAAKQSTRTPQPFIGSTNRWVDFALKSELVQGARSGKRFFTVSNPEMVRRMTFGSEEGQGDFYGKIVPQRLKNIVKKLDKNIAVTTDMDEARALRMEGKPVLGPVRMSTDAGDETVFGLDITPELRQKILGEDGRGLSTFRDGGIVSLLTNNN